LDNGTFVVNWLQQQGSSAKRQYLVTQEALLAEIRDLLKAR